MSDKGYGKYMLTTGTDNADPLHDFYTNEAGYKDTSMHIHAHTHTHTHTSIPARLHTDTCPHANAHRYFVSSFIMPIFISQHRGIIVCNVNVLKHTIHTCVYISRI